MQEFLGSIEILLRVEYAGLFDRDISLLQVVVKREQQSAIIRSVAFVHSEGFQATLLFGTHEDQLSLDPTLSHAVIAIIAAA